MEHGKWCRIRYRHGTAGFEMQLLCYPLEIRISNMQGREYLMYYESFRRSCTALRIEFIDEIEFYGKEAVRSMLAETEYHPSPETVDADLAHVRASMGYSLGVSTAERPEGNVSAPVRFCNFSPNGECRKMAGKGVQPLNDYTCCFRPSNLKYTDKSRPPAKPGA